jgi:hypothetical protein
MNILKLLALSIVTKGAEAVTQIRNT